MHEATLAQWQLVMNINVAAVFLGIRAVMPTMLAQEAREGGTRGTVITIASNAAWHGAPGKAVSGAVLTQSASALTRREQPYCASKAALVGMNKALAVVSPHSHGESVLRLTPSLTGLWSTWHQVCDNLARHHCHGAQRARTVSSSLCLVCSWH